MLQYELDQITIKRFFQMTTFELSSKFGGAVSRSNLLTINVYAVHPSLEQDLSLKIEERDQTIWICILEL